MKQPSASLMIFQNEVHPDDRENEKTVRDNM